MVNQQAMSPKMRCSPLCPPPHLKRPLTRPALPSHVFRVLRRYVTLNRFKLGIFTDGGFGLTGASLHALDCGVGPRKVLGCPRCCLLVPDLGFEFRVWGLGLSTLSLGLGLLGYARAGFRV